MTLRPDLVLQEDRLTTSDRSKPNPNVVAVAPHAKITDPGAPGAGRPGP